MLSKSESLVIRESSLKFGRSYRVLTALLGGIPLFLGMRLRSLVYQLVFDKIGQGVQVEVNVNFTRTYLISLGNRAYIRSGANLEVLAENSAIVIGEKATIERGADIRAYAGGSIRIGDRTFIGPYTCLNGRNVRIGQDCLIGHHCGIFAGNHIFKDAQRKINQQGSSFQGIVIEDDCWLGSGVKILDGVTVGKGSVIGAGTVVTKNVAPYSVAVGVPAEVVAHR
ncbi:MAG: DapH/DapD/GlmU-related protein [Spirulinaceae cyanobacterium]